MTLPKKVRLTIVFAVVAAAFATAGLLVVYPPPVSRAWWIAFVTLVAVSIFARKMELSITESGSTTSVVFLPTLGGLLLLGPVGAIGVELVTSIPQRFVFRRKPLYKAAFNTAQTVLALAAAALVYNWFGGTSSLEPLQFSQSFPPFMLAAATYFGVNWTAVSFIVSVNQQQAFLRAWRDLNGGIFIFDVTVSTLAYLIQILYALWGPVALLLSLLPVIGLRYSYGVNFELKQLNHDLLRILVKTIEARDDYTSGHSIRVSERARQIAEQLKLRSKLVQSIETGALLHDIGKIDIAYGEILRQAGPLTPNQRELIRAHPDKGVEIVSSVRSISRDVLDCIRHHHEWIDGSGYPTGIAGDEIPIGARIIMVSDSIDAMATDRPYRAALTPDEIRGELTANQGTQFDPEVVAAALACGILDDLDREFEESAAAKPQKALQQVSAI